MSNELKPTARQMDKLHGLIDEMFEVGESTMAHKMVAELRQGISRSYATSLIQISDHLLRTGSHAWVA